MSRPISFVLCPLALALALSASQPAMAGSTCQLLDANGNDIGDGGADGGIDTGGNALSLACGEGANANSASATAIGTNSSAAIGSTAIGLRAVASAHSSMAIGQDAKAGGPSRSTAVGNNATTSNYYAIALGADASASGASSIASGTSAKAGGEYSAAYGGIRVGWTESLQPQLQSTRADGFAASAFGSAAHADGRETVAFGSGSRAAAGADRAVALGAQSVATQADTVSLGHAAGELDYLGNAFASELNRRVVHLADGMADSDAASVGQLGALATALGAGAGFGGGVLTAPRYTIQGGSYQDVGAAFAAVDARLTLLGQQAGTPGPQGPAGPQGPTGPAGPQGPGSALGASYDDAGKTRLTLEGAGGTRVSNVAAGVGANDATNVAQMQAGDAAAVATAQGYADARSSATLSAANAYTDSRFAQWDDDFNALRSTVDQRMADFDRRLDRVGAMGGAMTAAAINTAGLPGNNRLGVGVGTQGGQAAMAVGYQRLVAPNVSVSLSAGVSGSDSSFATGAGFSW